MIIENNEDLMLIQRLTDWVDAKGMTIEHFLEMFKEMGLTFPLTISEYTQNKDGSFSFVCSTVSNDSESSSTVSSDGESSSTVSSDGESITYRIVLDPNESTPRSITFCNVHGFWSQPMLI